MKVKEKEFFKKLTDLCKEYEVSSFGESCANGSAIVSFKNSIKNYYYFMFSNNWGTGDEEIKSQSQIIEYKITKHFN